MLARCARCQGTFSTDRYGRLSCPHCGAELILPAPPGTPEEQVQAAPPPEPPREAAPPPAPPPGPPPGGYGPPPGWPPGPPAGGWGPPPPPPSELPSPFADRARLGFLAGFFDTWKLVATQPERFFARVRTDQPWSAVLFGVIAATVGNAAASLYAYFSGQQAIVTLKQLAEKMPEQARFVELYAETLTGRAMLAQLVLSPLLTFIAIYLGAALVHLLLRLFRGAGRGFDATLTAVAYTQGLMLLLAVPGCGALLAGVWALVSLVIGLGAIQRCGTGRAAAAVLAPFVLVCVCVCGALGLTVPALLKGAGDAAKSVPPTQL